MSAVSALVVADELVPLTSLPHVAFVGKAGAGKTTAAHVLRDQMGYTTMSFANELKIVASKIWGPEAMTDRDKLQRLGVAVRDIDPDAWVNVVKRELSYVPEGVRVVVDDCRFPNEYWVLKEQGFVVVRVQAPQLERISRLKAIGKLQDMRQLTHVSETALDAVKPDYVIWNHTNEDYLRHQIGNVLSREARRS